MHGSQEADKDWTHEKEKNKERVHNRMHNETICVVGTDSMPPQEIGFYDTITCPIVGCGAGLYLKTVLCTPLRVGTTADELADLTSAITQEWQVECVAGHIVVLPVDTAEDFYIFNFDPDHRDPWRLSETTGWRQQ